MICISRPYHECGSPTPSTIPHEQVRCAYDCLGLRRLGLENTGAHHRNPASISSSQTGHVSSHGITAARTFHVTLRRDSQKYGSPVSTPGKRPAPLHHRQDSVGSVAGDPTTDNMITPTTKTMIMAITMLIMMNIEHDMMTLMITFSMNVLIIPQQVVGTSRRTPQTSGIYPLGTGAGRNCIVPGGTSPGDSWVLRQVPLVYSSVAGGRPEHLLGVPVRQQTVPVTAAQRFAGNLAAGWIKLKLPDGQRVVAAQLVGRPDQERVGEVHADGRGPEVLPDTQSDKAQVSRGVTISEPPHTI